MILLEDDAEGAVLKDAPDDPVLRHSVNMDSEKRLDVRNYSLFSPVTRHSNAVSTFQNRTPLSEHPCKNFKLPPQPTDRRLGPRRMIHTLSIFVYCRNDSWFFYNLLT